MATEENGKTYEVGFSTEKIQHIFYINCPDDADAMKFAHAVLHYYDTPEEWGKKRGITAIAAIKPKDCIPDFLHIGLLDKQELAMPEENEASLQAVRKISKQVMDAGCVPMAIYDEENKTMTVYATKKLEVDPQTGASSVVLNFSLFGGGVGRAKK
ncbi:MAG: hypothetical protein Q8N54_05650 [Sulfurimicrobium sp.]|jgi:hypothetical protein|nr:hypothetical protein [Sulfurimicrobium sp.]MDP2197302.1 hypothetical protein [Sulfurimicrobium sp.]MDP2962226.1 hypothetical protein [Sulfurimicrobium sp.]MDP3687665.1 hypothetical protein [Sulfurimicrobium sp.]MDZ7657618.1 hypothetical protein [Sulfurimicrobium sp.]